MARAISEALESRRLLSFSAPVSYNIGTAADGFVPNAAPSDVVSADFNGDGKADLIVAHKADNSVYFLKGNGNGTFQPAVQIPVGQAIQGDVIVGDFNNDGKLDLLMISGNLDTPIVMLGNGDGTFKPAVTSSSFAYSGYYPRGWVVGDFNGDGKLDIACTLPSNTTNTGRYEVLLGNGNGTFGPAIVGPAVLGYSRNVAVGDFNHDGKLDLAIADGQGTSGNTANVEMTILLGNGDGTFTLGSHYASPQFPDGTDTTATSNPEDVVVADVNGDGKLDVIESDYDNTINVFLGNGDGTFQAAKSFDPGNYPRDVIPVDVNHDGKIDLVVTNVGINTGGALLSADGDEPGSVSVLLGNGDGTFQAPITYSPSVYPGWTAVGDFNGDGYPDLATSEVLNGHAVNVMLNAPTSINQPPVYVDPPSAAPDVVTNNTTVLSALASDDGGESNLTYTWATVGSIPGPVTYSINGTNASKNTTATFTTPGTYLFECAATDAQGLSIMDLATVTVDAATTTLAAPVAIGPGTSTSPGPVLTTLTPTLTWNGVSGVTGYQVNFYNVTTAKLVSYDVGASATSYTVTAGAMVAGDSYVWNVRGLNGTVTGPPSVNLYFQAPPAVVILPAPVAIGPGSTTSPGPVLTTSTPTLQWNAVTGASGLTGYQVSITDQTLNKTYTYQVGASVTSYAVAAGTLTAGDTFVWNVRALAGTQSGPLSASLYFQTPAAVVLQAPVAIGTGTSTSPGPVLTTLTPMLTWNGVSGVTGYQINFYNVTTAKLVSYDVAASATSYTVAAGVMVAGDSYVWNVRGLNGTVTGPPSVNLYFQAPPAVVILPAPVAIGPGTSTAPGPVLTTLTPTLAWNAAAGVTGYQINFYNVTTAKLVSYDVAASATSYTVAAGVMIAGDSYVWNVRGLNGTVTGPPSVNLYFQAPPAVILPAPVVIGQGSSTSPGPVLNPASPTFQWEAVAGVSGMTGYQINLYDQTLSKSYSYQVGTSVTSYSPPSSVLLAGDKFVWNVRILVGTQSGPPSTYLYFQAPPPATLSAPTAIRPITASDQGTILTSSGPMLNGNAVVGTGRFTGDQDYLADDTLGENLSY